MILVTGGFGFIGSNFISEWLRDQNDSVVNLDKLTYASSFNFKKQINKKSIFIKGDLNNSNLVKKILYKYQPKIVINFAAETHVDKSIKNRKNFINSNIVGTFNLLEQCLEHWKKLDQIEKIKFRYIQVSTDEVYGSLTSTQMPFRESDRYQPNNPYSASKASSDLLVRSYYKTFGFPSIITNCSNNYGPYQYPEKLIPLTILKALQKKSIPIYGDGKQIRDWIFVSDHCKALISIIHNGSLGHVYNIGGNCEVENLFLVKKVCSILDELKPLKNKDTYKNFITFVKDRLGHDRRYAIDNKKILSHTKWQPKIDLDEGLKRTVSWYLKNFKFNNE